MCPSLGQWCWRKFHILEPVSPPSFRLHNKLYVVQQLNVCCSSENLGERRSPQSPCQIKQGQLRQTQWGGHCYWGGREHCTALYRLQYMFITYDQTEVIGLQEYIINRHIWWEKQRSRAPWPLARVYPPSLSPFPVELPYTINKGRKSEKQISKKIYCEEK